MALNGRLRAPPEPHLPEPHASQAGAKLSLNGASGTLRVRASNGSLRTESANPGLALAPDA